MAIPGPENEGGAQRLIVHAAEETSPPVGAEAYVAPHPQDAGQALDTARTRDRLDWEDRCSTVQRRLNRAYDLELNGKRVRQMAWLVMRWCLVVLVASCLITWTGQIAIVIFCLSLAIGLLCTVGVLLGGAVELVSQLRQCQLLAHGERNHLEVHDPAAPIR